jgi:hypothetical protein
MQAAANWVDNRGERLKGCLTCDLWSTADGKRWKRLSEEEPPCATRASTTSVALTEAAVPRYYLRMRRLADIHLDVRSGDIIVDLPGTSYTVTYHKPAVSPQLLAAYLPASNDPRTELTQAEFLARAWRLANDKARELGWIA